MQILVLNSGSSSIKFSIYSTGGRAGAEDRNVVATLDGELTGVGSAQVFLQVDGAGAKPEHAASLEQAIAAVFRAVSGDGQQAIEAVGYRVVHPGPRLRGHRRIDAEVLGEIEAAAAFAPLHDPQVLQVIRAGMKRFAHVPHFACFDTVFHETMPEEATTYAISTTYRELGVRRYGFHGLSCESVVRQMREQMQLPRRLAIAHLGSGCSVTAVLDGRSVDNTMGLTPTGGVVMGTRPGDLDPGLVLYLLRQQKGSAAEAASAVEAMLNRDAGLVAISGMKNDVKAMRAAALAGDAHAALALKVFTRSVTKALGAYCFLLGGLDAIVFAGGIGEHDAQTRAEALAGLDGLGIQLAHNAAAVGGKVQRVSAGGSGTAVYVVPADEDETIAMHVARMVRDEGAGPTDLHS